MREVSATEAARRFSEMLDSVENRQESFVVMRRGRAVATIGPAAGSSGRAIKDVLARNRVDSAWSGELAELRRSASSETDPWRD